MVRVHCELWVTAEVVVELEAPVLDCEGFSLCLRVPLLRLAEAATGERDRTHVARVVQLAEDGAQTEW